MLYWFLFSLFLSLALRTLASNKGIFHYNYFSTTPKNRVNIWNNFLFDTFFLPNTLILIRKCHFVKSFYVWYLSYHLSCGGNVHADGVDWTRLSFIWFSKWWVEEGKNYEKSISEVMNCAKQSRTTFIRWRIFILLLSITQWHFLICTDSVVKLFSHFNFDCFTRWRCNKKIDWKQTSSISDCFSSLAIIKSILICINDIWIAAGSDVGDELESTREFSLITKGFFCVCT